MSIVRRVLGPDGSVLDYSQREGRASVTCRAIHDEGKGLTYVRASTPTPDRADDVVDQRSWILDSYVRNPVILYGHNSGGVVVGRAVPETIAVDDQGLAFGIEWDESEHNELGRLVAHQFRHGFLSAVSVGFIPRVVTARRELPKEDPYYGERGYVYRQNELLETSAVPVPMNPEALAIGRGLGTSLEPRALLRAIEESCEVRDAIQRLCWAAQSDRTPEGSGNGQTLDSLFGGATRTTPLSSLFSS